MKALLLAATVALAGCGDYWREAGRLAEAPNCEPPGLGYSTGAKPCQGERGENPFKPEAHEALARRERDYDISEARSRAFIRQWRAENPAKAAEADATAEYSRRSELFWATHDPCWAYFGVDYCHGIGRH